MTLVKFSPEKKTNNVLPGFSDIFESFFNEPVFSSRLVSRVPAANISETTDHYHIELAAPGLKKDDFKLQLEQNVLNISVEQEMESKSEQKNYSKREYNYTSFVRSFTLPESADENNIEAQYTDGVLVINIAKKEGAKSVRRQIEIK
ncbi:MAG TPA: Hsp20/alpha crystallin family protein [Mucilaginibacter sp.]|nr:Hsp20/alpha crystallin family protein [Mucilaginibacter sp.]